MADTGFGQQFPGSAASEFDELVFIIRQQLAKISTVKLVQVKAVDAAAKTVDVQPLVNQLDGQNNATPHGTILGVPYIIWQYGTNAVIGDPVVDDIGIMLCADRDISAVKATKAVAPPGSLRQLDAADGIYLGGILNGDPEQWVKFTDTGMELHDKNDNEITSSSTGWLFKGKCTFIDPIVSHSNLQLAGNIVDEEGSGIYAGDIHTSGTVKGDTEVIGGAAGIKLSAHRHGGVQTGGGQTVGPNNLP